MNFNFIPYIWNNCPYIWNNCPTQKHFKLCEGDRHAYKQWRGLCVCKICSGGKISLFLCMFFNFKLYYYCFSFCFQSEIEKFGKVCFVVAIIEYSRIVFLWCICSMIYFFFLHDKLDVFSITFAFFRFF
jgi:hypothetical protein